jgi:hypothetical protein
MNPPISIKGGGHPKFINLVAKKRVVSPGLGLIG